MGELKCKVVMLPHNQKQARGLGVHKGDGELYYWPKSYLITKRDFIPQHLYFTSNRDIHADDWFYNPATERIDKALFSQLEYVQHAIRHGVQKIEATTNIELSLPLIGEPFKQAYAVAEGKIEKVLIELCIDGSVNVRIDDGTVIVHKIKSNWTNEDLFRDMELMLSEFITIHCPQHSTIESPGQFVHNWLNNNY